MQNLTRTKLVFSKLATIILVAYAAVFYALPLGFFAFKPSNQIKGKPLADAGYELSEGIDFGSESQPGEGESSVFATFSASEATITCLCRSFAEKGFRLMLREPAKIFSVNCSYIFYG